jgi:RHS repeat-associated protein
VTYTYDLAGRVSTRTDGTGTTSLSWRFDGSPLTEDGAAAGRHLRRAYDASGRLLRLESSWGTQLGAVSATGSDQVSPAITYTYASADRLSSIASGGMTGTITRTSSQEALTVNFTGLYYSPHSTYNRILRNSYGQLQSHLASYTQYNFTSPTTFTIRDNTFTWDSNRLATRGEGDTTWNYTYDAKGQVEKAHRKFGAGEVLAGSQSIYVYDDIGNRKELQEGGTSALNVGLRTTTYTANSLNQYDAITRPQSFDVTGKRTSTSATITVNGVSLPTSGYQPNGNGLHFRKEVANTPAASLNGDNYAALLGDIFEPVTVSQTINGTTTDLTNDLTNDPIQFVPPSVTATPPRYDLDGNLLSDGRWTYTWDGENRLVKMVSIAWTQPSGGYLANATFPAITLEFAYDGLSRRVQKKTITSGTPTMEGYLYDGWNVLMISNLDPANGAHLARKWSCVWRPDVGSRLYARGSWQAAGGVAGLAWLQTGLAQTATMYTYQSVSGNAEVHIPMMDHMGNVRHYYQIKTTGPGASASYVTGQVTANLDYDAFGREVRATGTKTPASGQPPGLAPGEPWVDALPFHFSTKFTDRESGLNYYGYRFYDSVDGRWSSRDPIVERGGLNLYGMVGNNAMNRWDLLGLEVTGYYDISSKQLVINDKDTKEVCKCKGISGNNKVKDADKSHVGPIPPGAYSIYLRPGDYPKGSGLPAFILDTDDKKKGNDTADTPDVPGDERFAFRIHIEGDSEGCIVLSLDDLNKLKDFLDKTVKGQKQQITSPNPATPTSPERPSDNFGELPRLGTIKVRP